MELGMIRSRQDGAANMVRRFFREVTVLFDDTPKA
jgi:hypothetical protein